MINEILIASGKGGAGKTSITGAFSKFLGKDAIIADYDVDAANLSILVSKKIVNEEYFESGYIAEINHSYCIKCGKCKDVCKFNAIKKENDLYIIDKYSCEGCGLCYDVCLPKAIQIRTKVVGKWYEEETLFNSVLYSARLDPGSDNSGKLVNFLKEKAREKAEKNNVKFIISDAPPGIGCPVISSISGIDLLILVIEMGITGINDAIRLINVAKKFGIKILCIFNKAGMTDKLSKIENELISFLETESIEIIGEIPYNREFISLLQQNKLPIDSNDKTIFENFDKIFKKILDIICNKSHYEE